MLGKQFKTIFSLQISDYYYDEANLNKNISKYLNHIYLYYTNTYHKPVYIIPLNLHYG